MKIEDLQGLIAATEAEKENLDNRRLYERLDDGRFNDVEAVPGNLWFAHQVRAYLQDQLNDMIGALADMEHKCGDYWTQHRIHGERWLTCSVCNYSVAATDIGANHDCQKHWIAHPVHGRPYLVCEICDMHLEGWKEEDVKGEQC